MEATFLRGIFTPYLKIQLIYIIVHIIHMWITQFAN